MSDADLESGVWILDLVSYQSHRFLGMENVIATLMFTADCSWAPFNLPRYPQGQCPLGMATEAPFGFKNFAPAFLAVEVSVLLTQT